MMTIRLFSGWLAKVVIGNSSFIGSPTHGVNIRALKGNLPLAFNVENSTFIIIHHRRTAVTVIVCNYGNANVSVNLERCKIHRNGFGIEMYYTDAFSMKQTTITMNNYSGLILYVGSTRLTKVDIEGCNISHNLMTGLILNGKSCINIYNTTIAFNKNEGMFVAMLGQAESNGSQILLQDCTITDNTQTSTTNRETGLKASASGTSIWSTSEDDRTVTIKNIVFIRNKNHSLQPINLQLLRVTIQHCKFIDNHGSPIH